MRIVSLNAWGGALFDAFAEWLPSCDADVVCLQEVTRTPDLGGWTQFEDGERTLPQRANLFADVCALLPHHIGAFVACDAGPVTDPSGARHLQDFGLAIFVHERHTIVGQRADFVHGDFVVHHEWAIADRPRLAQAVRVHDRSTGSTAAIVHLHGLRDPDGKTDTPARRDQAHRLADLVTSFRRPDDLTVVCGDMNLLPDSETFQILASIGLTDLVGDAATRTTRYSKPIRHANYLLVSETEAVARFDIPQAPEVSDHCALVLDAVMPTTDRSGRT